MKKILSIAWYRILPPAYGGQKGIAFFNYYLGKKIPLVCLCPKDNRQVAPLPYTLLARLPSSRLQFWDPFTRQKILSVLRQQEFTHIIIEHPFHAWLGRYKQELGFRFIVHAHNIEHLRMKARRKTWWRLVKKLEQKAFSRADLILFKTEEDKKNAETIFNKGKYQSLIVPYGTILKEQPAGREVKKKAFLEKYGFEPTEKIIVFAGMPAYEPNAEAIGIIRDYIIPLLHKRNFRFRLFICGEMPAKRLAAINTISGVHATGFVPFIEDYLQVADVFINPVVSGSGIQTKNIEAIANGSNVVATSFAAIGLPSYLNGNKLFVSADGDWQSFADNILLAANRPADVPLQFYEEYNWDKIVDPLIKMEFNEAG